MICLFFITIIDFYITVSLILWEPLERVRAAAGRRPSAGSKLTWRTQRNRLHADLSPELTLTHWTLCSLLLPSLHLLTNTASEFTRTFIFWVFSIYREHENPGSSYEPWFFIWTISLYIQSEHHHSSRLLIARLPAAASLFFTSTMMSILTMINCI